jgi:hypothetical protein
MESEAAFFSSDEKGIERYSRSREGRLGIRCDVREEMRQCGGRRSCDEPEQIQRAELGVPRSDNLSSKAIDDVDGSV